MHSHISQPRSWCIDWAGQWFLVLPAECHCTFHWCNSTGMLRLLRYLQRWWRCFLGFFWVLHLWRPLDAAIAWSLWSPGNQWCWHTISLGGCWMLPTCEGDVAFPLLKCCLLVLGGPVECGQLEYELSCHCAGNRLNPNGLERNACMS